MSQNIFLASDLHLGHANILTFLDDEGNRIRPFNSIAEHDEILTQNWNKVVRPSDKVYVLGDVCFKNAHLELIGRLHGTRILIKGNHDELKPSQYLNYF